MNLQNPKITLLAIAALFMTPLILAMLMRSSWWGFEPSRFANRGILIDPPVNMPIDDLNFQYSGNNRFPAASMQWTLLYPIDVHCDESCLRDVVSLRQIHLATGKDRQRVTLWLLAENQLPNSLQTRLVAAYPEFNLLNDPTGAALDLLAAVSNNMNAQKQDSDRGQVYLLDPAANIILRYTPGFDPEDIKIDLDRLLSWSQ